MKSPVHLEMKSPVHLDHFIAQIRESDCIEDLRSLMRQAAADAGIGGFVYISRSVHAPCVHMSDHILISSFSSEWTEYHLKSRLSWFERIIERAAADHIPFFWGGPRPLPSAVGAAEWLQQEPMTDRAAGPGIRHGWTVPVHDVMGRIAALMFTATQGFDAFRHKVDSHKARLHVMAIYFHAHVRKALVRRAHAPSARLTPRELQCLGWAAQGKSRTDIGQIIGLSPRTIKFHLENAQRKLNVAHTTQAVLRAALLGLIALPEEL